MSLTHKDQAAYIAVVEAEAAAFKSQRDAALKSAETQCALKLVARSQRDALAAALRGLIQNPRPALETIDDTTDGDAWDAMMDRYTRHLAAARAALANVEGGAK